MNHSYGQSDPEQPPHRAEDVAGYILAAVAALLAVIAVVLLQPVPAHADGEGNVPLPAVIIKVEYVSVPSPLISPDRLVFDALTLAGEAHNVAPGYLSCLVWKESKFKPWAWVVDTNNRRSLGLVMLNEEGLLPQFYAWGYIDPFDPYEASDYLARKVAEGPAAVRHNWNLAFHACA